jgi:hypothetical protein
VPAALFFALALSTLWVRYCCAGEPGGRRQRLVASLYVSAPLWALVLVYGGVAIFSRINIGHRHIFPVYPAVFVWVGATGAWLAEGVGAAHRPARTLRLALVGGLLLWLAIETIVWWPHYLAYFNQAIGRPERAYRHLVDSNLDWGEELPALRAWLEQRQLNEPRRAYLSYFGNGDVAHYGIRVTLLPGAGFFDLRDPTYLETWGPGTYCISATMLQAVYRPPYGRWSREAEERYQALSRLAGQWMASRTDRAQRQKLLEARSAKEWEKDLIAYDEHRLHRLFSYLRVTREPAAEVGYGLLVYDLTEEDLERALRGPPAELAEEAIHPPPR